MPKNHDMGETPPQPEGAPQAAGDRNAQLGRADRNLGVGAGLLALFTLWRAWSRIHGGQWHKHSFGITATFSFAVTLAFIAGVLLWSSWYLNRHRKESEAFWKGIEGRNRKRIFRIVYVMAVALPIAAAVLAFAGLRPAVAAISCPTVLAVAMGIAQRTGQIRPHGS